MKESLNLKSFLVEVSARHIHLNEDAVEILFGKGYILTVRKNLSQIGQYVCNERVSIVGPKGELKNVSVLGPEREQVQVEISKTDARSINIPAPIRESGDLKGTPGCILVGPNGRLNLKEGVIVAKRHIHANLDDARELGVKDGDLVNWLWSFFYTTDKTTVSDAYNEACTSGSMKKEQVMIIK